MLFHFNIIIINLRLFPFLEVDQITHQYKGYQSHFSHLNYLKSIAIYPAGHYVEQYKIHAICTVCPCTFVVTS